MEKLLNRLDQLDKGTGRAATRKDDRKALELLAKRGIGPGVRKQLRDQVTIAKRPATLVPVDEAALKRSEDAHKAALVAVRVWYEEWADIARSAVKRRAHQIHLGLANRRTAKETDAGSTEGGGGTEGGAGTPGGDTDGDESEPRE